MASQPNMRDEPISSGLNDMSPSEINSDRAPSPQIAGVNGHSRAHNPQLSAAKDESAEQEAPVGMKPDSTNLPSSPVPDSTVHPLADRGTTTTERRFWNSTVTSPSSNATNSASSNKSLLHHWSYEKSSIAAATIITTVVVVALVFLVIWYIRGIRRAKRLREQGATQHGDTPGPSVVSLTDDTHKVLDDFLMKEDRPERASLMFSRSRSPSLTFVVDETDRRISMTRLYRTSYDASASSLGRMESSARISADGTRPSAPASERLSGSDSGVGLPASSVSPRLSRLSMSSTVSPTVRSSRLWTTTTDSMEMNPRTSGELSYSHTSQSNTQSAHALASPGESRPRSSASNASNSLTDPSSLCTLQLVSRMFDEAERSSRSRVASEGSSQSPAVDRAPLQSPNRASACSDPPG